MGKLLKFKPVVRFKDTTRSTSLASMPKDDRNTFYMCMLKDDPLWIHVNKNASQYCIMTSDGSFTGSNHAFLYVDLIDTDVSVKIFEPFFSDCKAGCRNITPDD